MNPFLTFYLYFLRYHRYQLSYDSLLHFGLSYSLFPLKSTPPNLFVKAHQSQTQCKNFMQIYVTTVSECREFCHFKCKCDRDSGDIICSHSRVWSGAGLPGCSFSLSYKIKCIFHNAQGPTFQFREHD